jgi:hypothetical protein
VPPVGSDQTWDAVVDYCVLCWNLSRPTDRDLALTSGDVGGVAFGCSRLRFAALDQCCDEHGTLLQVHGCDPHEGKFRVWPYMRPISTYTVYKHNLVGRTRVKYGLPERLLTVIASTNGMVYTLVPSQTIGCRKRLMALVTLVTVFWLLLLPGPIPSVQSSSRAFRRASSHWEL